jgi:hypothetical protein
MRNQLTNSVPVILAIVAIVFGTTTSVVAGVTVPPPQSASASATDPIEQLPQYTAYYAAGFVILTAVAFVATSSPVAAVTEEAALTQIAAAATATTAVQAPNDESLQSTVRKVTKEEARALARREFDGTARS